MSDSNWLLEEEPPVKTSRLATRLIPWLLLLALVLLFVPLYVGSASIEDGVASLATESDILQATITAPPAAPAQEETLTAHLLDLRSQLASLQDIPPTLIASHVDWPAIMSALHSYDASRIQLTGFSHDANHLTLEGIGLEESAVLEYADALLGTGFFSGVHIQSITLNPTAPATPESQTDTPLTAAYMPFVFTLSIDLAGDSHGSQ